MTPSLRMRVVEAGARALLALEHPSKLWESLNDIARASYLERSETVIDAMLDVLAENADEWSETEEKLHHDAAKPAAMWHDSHAEELRHLVQVLREDR